MWTCLEIKKKRKRKKKRKKKKKKKKLLHLFFYYDELLFDYHAVGNMELYGAILDAIRLKQIKINMTPKIQGEL
jgi:hypothetical protein